MDIKEFAQRLNGREYDYSMFTEKEIETAKENGWVIVSGVSDDLMEFEGAIQDEAGCYNGRKVYFSKYGFYEGEDAASAFPNCIEALWYKERILNNSGDMIAWTYKTDIPHETFMVYDDEEPYCRGIVFSVNDLR